MLFFTPWSNTNWITGVKRVCKRPASFDCTKPAACFSPYIARSCSRGEPITDT